MSSPVRRSARIAAQQQTPKKQMETQPPLAPKKEKKIIQRLPKNMEASTVVKQIAFDDEDDDEMDYDYDPNFQYTVDWIRNLRYQLSCFANDLEDDTHSKAAMDLARQVQWQWGNIREWMEEVHWWYKGRNNTTDLHDEREYVRGTIENCYDALKKEEEKISKIQHVNSYYYPPDQPTKARMIRSDKIVAHINEFTKLCRGFGITIHKGDEDTINPYLEDNWVQIDEEASDLLYEGCPSVPLRAFLQPNQITNILTFSKRFAPSWDGKVNKWGYTNIHILLE